MAKIVFLPPSKEELNKWRELNKQSIGEIESAILQMTINQVIYLTEMEQEDSEKFEDYIFCDGAPFAEDEEGNFDRDKFRLVQKAVFEHLHEVKTDGLGVVTRRLKKTGGK